MQLITCTQKGQLSRLGAAFITTKNKQGWGGQDGRNGSGKVDGGEEGLGALDPWTPG